jgi:predicted Zn finger-like uncharacterized protein
MSIIVACPSCGSKLRVADELQGQLARCPKCDHTFDTARTTEPPPSAPASESSPVPQDLPLELAIDGPSSEPRPAPPGGTPGLVGAVELTDLKLSLDDDPPPPPRTPEPPKPPAPPRLADEHDDLKTCPACGKHVHRDATRCSHCGERFAGRDMESIRHRGQRRDSEPDRGTVVLTLGILSLVSLAICAFFPLIGAILGLIAWIMGQTDLRKMRKGDMDPNGQGMTQAGWICGIIGTILNSLLSVLCLLYVGFIFMLVNNAPVKTAPAVGRPVPQWAPQPPKQPNPPMKKVR